MKMTRNYRVQTKIKKPVAEVFAAVVAQDKLTQYFVDGSSASITEGAEIQWHWDHYGDLPVKVISVVENQRIELELDSKKWGGMQESYPVTVLFEFEALENGSTMMSISEAGWKTDPDGLKNSHDNCSGWTHMAMCLKAWLEHSIDLR